MSDAPAPSEYYVPQASPSGTMGLAPPAPKLASPTAPGLTGAEADRRRAAYADAGNAALSNPSANPYAPSGANAAPQLSNAPPVAPQIRPPGVPGAGGAGGGVRDAVREAGAQVWRDAGYPEASVRAIMRRSGVETSGTFDPHIIGDGGTSIGLLQHHADRAQKLAQYIQANKVDTRDPVALGVAQMKFAVTEMDGGDPIAAKARDALKSGRLDENAAYGLFTSSFERPKGAPGSEETNLRSTAFGGFSPEAKALVGEWSRRRALADEAYKSSLGEAKDLRSLARAATAKWMEQTDRPPQNMRQAWSQWSGVAIGLAMLAPAFGRANMTAALGAAGAMLEGANAADVHNYDLAYKHWKDHLDQGLKAIDLLHNEARDITQDAKLSYDGQLAQLDVLAKAYGIAQTLDHSGVQRLSEGLDLQKKQIDVIDAQNKDSDIRNSAADKDKAWLEANQPPDGKVPSEIHNQHVGQATQEHTGASLADKRALADRLEAKYIADDKMDPAEAKAKAYRDVGLIPGGGALTPSKAQEAEVQAEIKRLNDASDAANPNATPTEKAEQHHKNQLAARTEMAMATAKSGTGAISDEQASILADQYIQGNYAVITQLPRSGPSRLKVENMVGEKMRGMPDAARTITMNRLRMVEAESAARTAGRVTMNTEMFATEASQAGAELKRVAKVYADATGSTKYPKVNEAIRAYELNTGDPHIIEFGVALNALRNAYGKMSNPTGTGVHDADKEQFAKILDTRLSNGQIDAGVNQIITEGRIMSNAAVEAQEAVLGRIAPRAPGAPEPAAATAPAATAAPVAPAAAQGVPVPAEHRSDPDGKEYHGSDGKTYVKRGDRMVPQ